MFVNYITESLYIIGEITLQYHSFPYLQLTIRYPTYLQMKGEVPMEAEASGLLVPMQGEVMHNQLILLEALGSSCTLTRASRA